MIGRKTIRIKRAVGWGAILAGDNQQNVAMAEAARKLTCRAEPSTSRFECEHKAFLGPDAASPLNL